MKYIFIDTNVCLHFTEFDKYPWYSHFTTTEELTLILTHPLIEEIDKKKYSGKTHLKRRAISALKKIESISNLETHENLKIELFNEVVSRDFIVGLGMDPSDGDDKMIAAILKFKDFFPDKRDIYFISNDLGPRLKVAKYDIKALVPSDKHLLKNPEDELEKKIRNLKIENEKLKNLSPKLSVTFKDSSNIFRYNIEELFINQEQYIHSKLNKQKTNFKRLKLKDELEREKKAILEKIDAQKEKGLHTKEDRLKRMMVSSFPIGGYGAVSEDDKVKYNRDLNQYFKSYEHYLEELYELELINSLTFDFELELNNKGSVPAEDIDIYLHFPDGFELFDEGSYPEKPNLPIEPRMPRSIFNLGQSLSTMPRLNIPESFIVPNLSSSSVSIKKTNSYDVDIFVRELKHNKIKVLETMFVTFKDYDSLINFEVDYEIRCSNIPEVVKGSINFVQSKSI